MIVGAGAAGIACTKILLAAGVQHIVGVDRTGAIHRGRDGLDEFKRWYAENTNADGFKGTADEALRGADVFIGLSGPGAVSVDAVLGMADDAIVFAMANPTPEVPPEAIAGHVAVIATGRSDYPNQINNVLAFPGIFRGALDVRASEINEAMKLAAGQALASVGRARPAIGRVRDPERLQPGRRHHRRRGRRAGRDRHRGRAARAGLEPADRGRALRLATALQGQRGRPLNWSRRLVPGQPTRTW